MRHTETNEVHRTETIIKKVTCDICGAVITHDDPYDAEEVTVAHKTGTAYSDGGSGETVSVDMCGRCFDERLVPWLKSHGAEPRTEEWLW